MSCQTEGVHELALELELESLDKMFLAFAPAYAERWSYLLRRKPDAWKRISPMSVWPKTYPCEDGDPNFMLKPRRLLSEPDVNKQLETECILLRCGQYEKNPSISRFSLRDAFPNGVWNFEIVQEGFVSIVPGRLALGLNHEGGMCVFRI
jgi:hypothetical protein